MKILTVLLISITASVSGYGQTLFHVKTETRPAGKNYNSDNPVVAKIYQFPERVHQFNVDTTLNSFLIQLRGINESGENLKHKGSLALYNFSEETVKWSIKVNYFNGRVKQSGNLPFVTKGGKRYLIDIENGNRKWKVKDHIYYLVPSENTAVGYKYASSPEFANAMEGIDLSTGKIKWKRDINRDYSWNDACRLSDSVLLIVSSGLHTVNLKNGKGWDFNTVTGEENYSQAAIDNMTEVASNELTYIHTLAQTYRLVREVASNVILDDPDIYFASREKILKTDFYGNVKWISSLERDKTSKSSIFEKDSLLYMVNYGYAIMVNRIIKYGTPYFCMFNSTTGEQGFCSFPGDRKDIITSYVAKGDAIFFLFKDKIEKYSINDGQRLLTRPYDVKELGELKYFLDENVFFKSDTIYKPLCGPDSTKYPVLTGSGKTLLFNGDLNVVDILPFDNIYVCYHVTKNYLFLRNHKRTVVINKSGNAVASLNVSADAFFIGSKLYDKRDNCIVEIDTDELLNE